MNDDGDWMQRAYEQFFAMYPDYQLNYRNTLRHSTRIVERF